MKAPVFEPLIGCEDAARLLGNMHVKTLQRYARNPQNPCEKGARKSQ
jgi:hypothetical protein